ncbi:MAG: hypothetical protein ACPG7F_08460 [Aggregatilineales bacterium]
MYARLMDTTDKDDKEVGVIHTEIREGADGKGRKLCDGPSMTFQMANKDLFVKGFVLAIRGDMPYPPVSMGLEVSSYFRYSMNDILKRLEAQNYELVESIGKRRRLFGLF